MMNVKYWLFWY